jgi:hypothetical protein
MTIMKSLGHIDPLSFWDVFAVGARSFFGVQFPTLAALSPVPYEYFVLSVSYTICIVCPCCEYNKDCSVLNLQPGHYTHYANPAVVRGSFFWRIQ